MTKRRRLIITTRANEARTIRMLLLDAPAARSVTNLGRISRVAAVTAAQVHRCVVGAKILDVLVIWIALQRPLAEIIEAAKRLDVDRAVRICRLEMNERRSAVTLEMIREGDRVVLFQQVFVIQLAAWEEVPRLELAWIFLSEHVCDEVSTPGSVAETVACERNTYLAGRDRR